MPTKNIVFEQMSERLPRLWLPLLLLSCMAFAWRPLSGSDDVWAHAAIGRWIVEHQQAPRETLFLWSVPPQPWVYHSWLSQVIFYAPLSLGDAVGANLLLLLTGCIAMAVFALLWWAWCTRINAVSLWMPLVFALALYASSLRFRPRPELFSALLLTLLLCLLWKETGRRRALWLEAAVVFFLFVLWANLHGAVAIGLVLLGAFVVTELIQERFSRPSWRGVLLLGVAIVAVCFTPYGVDYWQALRPVGGALFQRIDEWKPFWKAPVLNPEIVVGQFVLVWLAAICWLGNKERRWSHAACLLIMTLMFIGARRHLWLLPIVSVSVIAANAQTLGTLNLRNSITPAARQRARWLMTGVLAVLLAQAISPENLRSGGIMPTTPIKATAYFKQHRLSTQIPVFNDYENSSFLQWRFSGQPPLFIDLLNAYPDYLISDYFDIINARSRGRTLLEEKKVQAVILRAHKSDSPLAKLAQYLNQDARWKRIYSGKDAVIWLRRNVRVETQ